MFIQTSLCPIFTLRITAFLPIRTKGFVLIICRIIEVVQSGCMVATGRLHSDGHLLAMGNAGGVRPWWLRYAFILAMLHRIRLLISSLPTPLPPPSPLRIPLSYLMHDDMCLVPIVSAVSTACNKAPDWIAGSSPTAPITLSESGACMVLSSMGLAFVSCMYMAGHFICLIEKEAYNTNSKLICEKR